MPPSDTVRAVCAHCGTAFNHQLPPKVRGAAGQCPSCRRWFTVVRPAVGSEPVPPQAERVKKKSPPG